MSSSHSFALDVAAPSAHADPDAPWVGAFGGGGDKGLAAMFWIAFHGLSVFGHATAIFLSLAGPVFLTLVPIPFLATMCVDVKPVVKPLERVELAIIEVAPEPATPIAPALDLSEAAPEPTVEIAVKKATKSKRAHAVLDSQIANAGILAMLGSSNDGQMFASLTATEGNLFGSLSGIEGGIGGIEGGVEGGVVGGLIGSEIGEAYGVGGLGLRGSGEGGGGSGGGGSGFGTIGLGTIGTIGMGTGTSGTGTVGANARPRVALDGASPAQLVRLARSLVACRVTESVEGTAVVKGGRIASATATPTNPCVEKAVRAAGTLDVEDGVVPFAITPP